MRTKMFGFGITARNVNEALPLALALVKDHGVPVTSRGLETLEIPGPTMTVYNRPMENVLMDPTRDANPFFHFFESMWILSGSDRAELPAYFLKSIKDYSDDGHRFHGAYGNRLRNWMPSSPTRNKIDQLHTVVEVLREKPDTRQAVASIWNPALDLAAETKDVPCNDMLMFKIRDGALNLTVCNRSNDIIWGAYGANAVQFSFIQMWVAAMLGVKVGKYTQISDSLHVYTHLDLWKAYAAGTWRPSGQVLNPYDTYPETAFGNYFRTPDEAAGFMEDSEILNALACENLLGNAIMWPTNVWKSDFGRYVARPMLVAYAAYKVGDLNGAYQTCLRIGEPYWMQACAAWIERRRVARAALADSLHGIRGVSK